MRAHKYLAGALLAGGISVSASAAPPLEKIVEVCVAGAEVWQTAVEHVYLSPGAEADISFEEATQLTKLARMRYVARVGMKLEPGEFDQLVTPLCDVYDKGYLSGASTATDSWVHKMKERSAVATGGR